MQIPAIATSWRKSFPPAGQPARTGGFRALPQGFLPQINPDIEDRSFSTGMRAAKGAWDVDFTMTQGGYNSFQLSIENTNNASMGAASPVSFDAGRLGFTRPRAISIWCIL